MAKQDLISIVLEYEIPKVLVKKEHGSIPSDLFEPNVIFDFKHGGGVCLIVFRAIGILNNISDGESTRS